MGHCLAYVLPRSRQEVSSADVVFALVTQRCVAPGSKLSAERWGPVTALPELLGVAAGSFNNDHIHRMFEALDEASARPQAELVYWAHAWWGRTTTWSWMEVTDASFEGHRCALVGGMGQARAVLQGQGGR